ncbi:hypothetical protein NMG60_11003869, partial [Bertholletia excelsa]
HSDIATINTDNLSIYPLPTITRQEPNKRTHILGLSQSTQRVLLHHPPHRFLRLPSKEHFCRDGAWRHAIRCNPRPFQLLGHNLHHGLHRRLGRRIGRVSRPKRSHQRGRQANNPSTAAPFQPLRRLLADQECPPRVHAEDSVEVVEGRVGEGGVLGIEDAGRIDHDVGLGVESGLGGVEEALNLGGIGYGGVELGCEGVGLGGVGGVVDDDFGA